MDAAECQSDTVHTGPDESDPNNDKTTNDAGVSNNSSDGGETCPSVSAEEAPTESVAPDESSHVNASVVSSCDDSMSNPVLHILVVGFHHQKGSQIEFCHPPLPNTDGQYQLPEQWKSLPFLALPDGSHNFDKGSVYFHLKNANTQSRQTVFGVSCHRQVDSKDLKQHDEEVTRSTVQKGVCVLLNQPLYGSVESKLDPVTHAYFNQMDFSKTEILVDFYESLNRSMLSSHFTDAIFHVGLRVRDMLAEHKEKVLILMKAMLLQRKVVVYANSATVVSELILSLVSLFPGMLQKGVMYAALSPSTSEDGQTEQGISSPTDQFGFPLRLFDKDALLHPYHSLQQMDSLKTAGVNGFVVGVANILYLQYAHCPADLLFNVGDGDILIRDGDLSQALNLTTEDRRFIDFLVTTVNQWNDGETHSHWEGSDDWVRFHFKAYLLCLASTTSTEDSEAQINSFNPSFVDSWKRTTNYTGWLQTERPGLMDFPHGHPFAGEISVSDVRLRLQRIGETILAYSGPGQRLGDAVRKTGEIVGTVYNSAKWTLSSLKGWMSGVVEELDQEMATSLDSVEKAKEAEAETLEEGMTISRADRLGGESAS